MKLPLHTSVRIRGFNLRSCKPRPRLGLMRYSRLSRPALGHTVSALSSCSCNLAWGHQLQPESQQGTDCLNNGSVSAQVIFGEAGSRSPNISFAYSPKQAKMFTLFYLSRTTIYLLRPHITSITQSSHRASHRQPEQTNILLHSQVFTSDHAVGKEICNRVSLHCVNEVCKTALYARGDQPIHRPASQASAE